MFLALKYVVLNLNSFGFVPVATNPSIGSRINSPFSCSSENLKLIILMKTELGIEAN